MRIVLLCVLILLSVLSTNIFAAEKQKTKSEQKKESVIKVIDEMNLFVTDTYYISQCVLKKAYRVKIEAERQYFLETPNVVNQKLLLSIYNADYNSPTYYDSRNIEYQEIDKIVNALSKMFETANKWRDEGRKGSNNIFLTTEKGIVIGYQRKKNEGQSAYIQLNENKLFDFKEIIELNCLKDSFKKGKIFLDTYPDSLGGE